MAFMARPGAGISLGHNLMPNLRVQACDRSGASPGKLIKFPVILVLIRFLRRGFLL